MNKKLCMILVGLMGATAFVGCGNQAEADNEVVIFSSMEDYRNEALEEQLEEKLPNVDVVVQQYSTGNNAAKIKAEGTDTEADIVLGLETALLITLRILVHIAQNIT